ncbi:ATP-binding protein [Gellertiella hungarica]|nr:ATP-binding protein [Gellertiella hungarica]
MGFSPDGSFLRDAGKKTVILQGFAVVLTCILVLLFTDLARRYRLLEDGIRENALWSVFQLDREARTLSFQLKDIVRDVEPGPKKIKDLSLRYDILYSRINMLKDSRFDETFEHDPAVREALLEVRDKIIGYASLFDRIQSGYKPTDADLLGLNDQVETLVRDTGDFLISANNHFSTARADNRDMIIRLEGTTALFLSLLLASVVFLVVNLRRQLKVVREAGRNFELMAEELSDAYKAADAGNRAKSQFMATMSHEIRTPLNAILGTAELLELSDLPADAASLVRTIHSSGEALLEIINEILDYSKIENGKLELELRSVNLKALSKSTLEIVRGRAEEHGNRIVLDVPEELMVPYVRTDPTRLRQVLLNLLSNAVKFTRNGTVTLRLREFVRDDVLIVRFEVQDTGIGIDEAGIAKLFQPFTQVDASISRKYGGTGLGLTICKQIIDKLEGELGVRSELGAGSTFWLEIPTKIAEVISDQPPAARSPNELANLPSGHVLLVEDNAVNQQVATRFLERLGQKITIANNGVEAVEIARRERFDIILMDMQMPEMDGIQATRRIRAEVPDVAPIIAMTANASDDDRRRCIEAGMVGFESKPITLKRLRHVLETHLKPGDLPAAVEEIAAATPAPVEEADGFSEARRNELIEALGEDVFNELVETFFEDAGQIMESLQHALGGEDAILIDRLLHTLKGAAINVGLNDVADLAHSMRDSKPTIAGVEILNDRINAHRRLLVA